MCVRMEGKLGTIHTSVRFRTLDFIQTSYFSLKFHPQL